MHTGKVECPIWKKKVSLLKRHMRHHEPKKNCTVCGKMFTEHHLPLHMKTHSKAHKCENCEEIFENREVLRRWVMNDWSNSFAENWLLIVGTTWPSILTESFSIAIADQFSKLTSIWGNIKKFIMRSKYVEFVRKNFWQGTWMNIGRNFIWRRMESLKATKVSSSRDLVLTYNDFLVLYSKSSELEGSLHLRQMRNEVVNSRIVTWSLFETTWRFLFFLWFVSSFIHQKRWIDKPHEPRSLEASSIRMSCLFA